MTGRAYRLKIVKARHWTEHLVLSTPYRIANQTITDIENHFVQLQSDDGNFGYGAASPGDEVTGESLAQSTAALTEHLEENLLGKDLRCFPALIRRLQQALSSTPAAMAAVDMALYDLIGKRFDIPLVDLFGRRHLSLPTSITIGIQSIAASLAEAEEYIGRGFKVLKIKIGEALEEDISLLKQLREKVGPHIRLRVDINQGYSVDDLLSFFGQTEHLDLELIEQPLRVSEIEEMRRLPGNLRRICAGDESLQTPQDALICTHPPRPFGIYNVKLMKCGGITPSLQIAHTAQMAGIDLMWGCNDESCVSIAAALHAALATSTTRYLDLDGSFDLGRDIFEGGFVVKNGELSPTDAPGLGVTPKT